MAQMHMHERKLEHSLSKASPRRRRKRLPKQLGDEGEWVIPEYRELIEQLRMNDRAKKLRLKLVDVIIELRGRDMEEVFRLARKQLLTSAVSSIACLVNSLQAYFANYFKSQKDSL